MTTQLAAPTTGQSWLLPFLGAATVGSGLVGGVFLTFSGFVMPALRRLPTAEGVRAMQAINRAAVGPALMITLFGTAVLAVAASVAALRSLGERPSPWLLAGSACYLVSAVVVTIAANVPLNDRLAALDPTHAEAAWQGFLSVWTRWNHVRTVGCIAATACFVRALWVHR